ncbi:bifunctional metallophosphatase/5'-nucleotidase [Alkalicoccus chagannorensis]|uniref:bifunctional metallophosphatase/5'-nucleotidase n=1 Tax=Alkalicoccus chagannorensis TaxID=427072 RepID=UPI00040D534A|nr:bifunctional UDP-sugar hydrolase/5'-nucleotidase [Alkalicoccus chagannorensis]
MTTLTILHTNDLHSELQRWPKAASILRRQRQAALDSGRETLLLDIGDHADRAHPVTEGLAGRGNIRLLNDLEYDAVTIGNNEGITFAKEDLDHLYDEADFEVLLANVKDGASGLRPSWCIPWKIHTLSDGTRIAMIGLTFPFYAFYQQLGWQMEDPLEVLGRFLPEMKQQSDFIICLSHLGLRLDEKMAAMYPDVDLCLGAHTHHVLEGGRKINQTWVHQCGRGASHVGEITIDTSGGRPEVVHIETHETEQQTPDRRTSDLLQQVDREAGLHLRLPVAHLQDGLSLSWYESSPFAAVAAEAVRDWCQADVSMFNAGLLLEGLPSGEVHNGHLHAVCPHPINPAVLHVTGKVLKQLMRTSSQEKMIRYALKGYGFRGKILGYTMFQSKTENMTSASVIEKEHYRLAVPDLFTFSHLYPELTEGYEVTYFMPEFLRDVLRWKLSSMNGSKGVVEVEARAAAPSQTGRETGEGDL